MDFLLQYYARTTPSIDAAPRLLLLTVRVACRHNCGGDIYGWNGVHITAKNREEEKMKRHVAERPGITFLRCVERLAAHSE